MADTKLSALTELTVPPLNTDELYINDGGTSKKITYGNLITSSLHADGFAGGNEGAKVQAAIDALPATGGVVDARGFTTGTISTVITLTANTTVLFGDTAWSVTSSTIFDSNGVNDIAIIGAGIGRTVFTYGTNAAADNTPAIIVDAGTTNARLEGFTIDGNSANQTNGDWRSQGIQLDNVSNIHIKRNEITDTKGMAVDCFTGNGDVDHVHVKENRFVSNSSVGDNLASIYFRLTSTFGANHWWVSDNYLDNTATNEGIIKVQGQSGYSGTSTHLNFLHNRIVVGDGEGHGTLGIELINGTGNLADIVIDGNSIQGQSLALSGETFGISLSGDSIDKVRITNNHIKWAGFIPIEIVEGPSSILIDNNIVDASGAILIGGSAASHVCTNVVFSNNTFRDMIAPETNDPAITVQFTSTSTMTGLKFIGNTWFAPNKEYFGIWMNNSSSLGIRDITIVGNTFHGFGTSDRPAFQLDEVDGGNVSGNYFDNYDDPLGGVIQLQTCQNVSGDSNTFNDTTVPNWAFINDGGTNNNIRFNYGKETATGTVTLLPGGISTIDSSGGAVTATLGSGENIGEPKTVVMTDATNSSTLSVTNHSTSDPEVFTFDAVDEALVLMWTGTEWITVASDGVTT